MSTRWEYRSIKFDFNAFFKTAGDFDNKQFVSRVNQAGAEGWELVNTFDTNCFDGDTRFIIAVFKRPL